MSVFTCCNCNKCEGARLIQINNLKLVDMEELFNNQELINNIASKADKISKYRIERNWFIGLTIAISLVSVIVIINLTKQNSKLRTREQTE